MSEVAPPKIYAAVAAVLEDLGAVGKDKSNQHGGYKYRSIDQVLNALNPVLSKHKVFFVPNVLSSVEEKFKSKQGTDSVRVKLRVAYKIYTTDGSSIDALIESEGTDTSDKATNKALSAAFKFLTTQIFCIAYEGMVDADADQPDAPPAKAKEAGKDKQQPVKKEEPITDALAKLADVKLTLSKFAALNVTESLILMKFQLQSIGEITHNQLQELRQIGLEITNKRMTAKEAFPVKEIKNHAPGAENAKQ